MVLVAGGKVNGITLASTWNSMIRSPVLVSNRPVPHGAAFHSATLLGNGKVLVAGGRDSRFVELASAELYNPATGTWSATGSLNTARYDPTATLLPNGKVLVARGTTPTNSTVPNSTIRQPAPGH